MIWIALDAATSCPHGSHKPATQRGWGRRRAPRPFVATPTLRVLWPGRNSGLALTGWTCQGTGGRTSGCDLQLSSEFLFDRHSFFNMSFVLVLLQDSLLCGHRAYEARWVTQAARLHLVKASIAQARAGRRAPQAATPLTVMREETKHGQARLPQTAITYAGRVHRVSTTLGDHPAPLQIL